MTVKELPRYEFNVFTLKNGLKVIHIPVKEAHVVEIEVWFHTGSADETANERGLAHVLEHMIFKGTKRISAKEFAGKIESLGGYINAFTSNDNTVYHITIVKEHLEEASKIFSEVLSHPSIASDELKKELDVILEEWKRGEDIPENKLYKEFFLNAYTNHPYRYPTIGTPETISSFTRDQVLNFYRKWYNSSNATLVLAGEITYEEAKQIAEKYFSQLPSPKKVERQRPEEPPQKNLRTFTIEGNFLETRVMLGFHTVPLSHPDAPALEILAYILTENYSSRLNQTLVVKKNIVHDLFSYSFTPLNSGMFLIGFSAESKNVKEAIEDICKELKILPETISTEELEKARISALKEYLTLNQKVQKIAKEAGYFDAFTGSPDNLNKHIEKLNTITKEDIIKVLEKYIKINNLTAGVILEKNSEVKIDNESLKKWVEEGFQKGEEEVKKLKAVKEVEQLQDWEKLVLKNDMKLLIKEVPESGMVTVSIMIKGGTLYENSDQAGISNFAAKTLIRGTKNLSQQEIMETLDEIGGTFSASAGKDNIIIKMSFLKGFEEEGAKLLKELLLYPSFPEEEVEKVRKQILDDIKAREDYLPALTTDLFEETLYRNHPYRFNPLGTEETIKRIKRADILNFWKKVVNAREIVAGIVGDLSNDGRSTFILSFSEFPSFASPLPAPPSFIGISKVLESTKHIDKHQTHILLGFSTVPLTHPDTYPLLVLDGILSGQGGRVFQELREKKHLAYALTSILKRSSQPGYIAIYLACDPAKYSEAKEGIREVLQELRENGVSDEEVERAKNMLIGNYWIWLQTNGAKADFMVRNEFYGIGYDSFKDYPEQLQKITFNDVNRIIRKYITPEAYVITTVGSIQ